VFRLSGLVWTILLASNIAPAQTTPPQSIVVTWEDDAQIELVLTPDHSPVPTPPTERISGGITGTLSYVSPAYTAFLTTDYELQSASWTVRMNTLYGGPTCDLYTLATVTYKGVQYAGLFGFTGSFTGTLDAPGEVKNVTAFVNFHPEGNPSLGGYAMITGTLRAELSDYPATVVKLRQGIEPLDPSLKFVGSGWSDFNPPWESNLEPSDTPPAVADQEIYNIGCRLTSLSMALNSLGIHFVPKQYCGPPTISVSKCPPPVLVPNDPGALNAFASKPSMQSGTLANGVVDPWDVLYALSQPSSLNKTLNYNAKGIECPSQCTVAEQFLGSALMGGHPVIVGVEEPPVDTKGEFTTQCHKFPCHYVLVWGRRNFAGSDEWLIADPWPTIGPGTTMPEPRLKLSDWAVPGSKPPQAHYVTEAYVTDPATTSGLDVNTSSNVELLLTGPTGQRTGYDSGTNTIFQEGGAYIQASVLDDAGSAFSAGPSRFILLSSPADGQYSLGVHGIDLGTYSINFHSYANDGSVQPVVTLFGIAGAGSASSFDVSLSTMAGSPSSITRTASGNSALADVKNSLSLGLIKNSGLAALLSSLLKDAAAAQARGKCIASQVLLRAFIDVVHLFAGKGIDASCAIVLTEDAQYLINNCKNCKN
jgi:hypothetical protein